MVMTTIATVMLLGYIMYSSAKEDYSKGETFGTSLGNNVVSFFTVVRS